MRTIVKILVGASGSGKSTLAAGMEREARPVKSKVVSADHYFTERSYDGVYRFDPSLLGFAHGQCLRRFIGAVADGYDVIVVDNTNTTTEEIAPYYAIATAYGCAVEIHKIESSPETCAARNVHGVPIQGIKGQIDRIARLTLPPFWQVKVMEYPAS